ncbi:MAG: hypothetical protein QOG30_1373 [Acidimicrobiaceae bacterium]|jgi:hypothetical protein
MNSGPPPLLGLVAALVVLVAGIAGALTRDDSTSTSTAPGIVTPTRPVPTTPTTSTSTSRSTFTTLPPTALSTTSTTVRPAVPTPEAAANGLWAAYSSGNRSAAARFASPAVVDALFSTPFDGETGSFQGCTKRTSPGLFDCQYDQPSTHYALTAEADAAGSFKIVVITITSTETTTSSTNSSSSG